MLGLDKLILKELDIKVYLVTIRMLSLYYSTLSFTSLLVCGVFAWGLHFIFLVLKKIFTVNSSS